ncbi:hypothetical protein CANTEDRAFT_136098 [Yamadazyma tenuis ATCC 10573]|nr:uncharacterized protein CANTEDRAFT_136098 [Yamadazyma tenuis ATCC 10573]EGV62158.1 hypothetical protein CANTEDRAFT_136098 [Yamadazyma tenuis ATCC 10573]
MEDIDQMDSIVDIDSITPENCMTPDMACKWSKESDIGFSYIVDYLAKNNCADPEQGRSTDVADDCDKYDDDYRGADIEPAPVGAKRTAAEEAALRTSVAYNYRTVTETLEKLYKHCIYIREVLLCSHCPKKFETVHELALHCQEFNLYKGFKYKCPLATCPFKLIGFNKKLDLRRHVTAKHIDRKTFEVLTDDTYEEKFVRSLVYFCHCQRVFYRRDSLQRHQRLIHRNS